LFAMFSLSPRFTFYCPADLARPFASDRRSGPPAVRKRDHGSACPLHPQTSYWLSDANEMAAINTILIIVNSAAT
jgi:hypothetical protein